MDSSFQLRSKNIILNLKAGDRFTAYEEMVSVLVKNGDVNFTYQTEVLSYLRTREEQTTFAVGRNLAFPHINGALVKECTFLYARSTDGIEFGSCDTGLIHHLFLALIPEDKKCGWLKTLSGMAKKLSRVELREQLMQSDDITLIRSLLEETL